MYCKRSVITLERLIFRKDLREVDHWIENLEFINLELEKFIKIEKRFLKIDSINYGLLSLRRSNTLIMARFCKYQLQIKQELEYGSKYYSPAWLQAHEMHKKHFLNHRDTYGAFKINILKSLLSE